MIPDAEIVELLGTLPPQLTPTNLAEVSAVLWKISERLTIHPLSERRGLLVDASAPIRQTLLNFAWAGAQIGLRNGDSRGIEVGLRALAVEGGQLDYRDSLIALAMLCDCARRLELDEQGMCQAAAPLSSTVTFSDILDQFPRRELAAKAIRNFGVIIRTVPGGLEYTQDLGKEESSSKTRKGLRRLWPSQSRRSTN